MKILMISLDNKILDKNSAAARRMIKYGETDKLFILIPNRKEENFDLSKTVHVFSTGGNKIQQYFRLKKIGKKIIHNSQFEIQDSLITTQDPFFTGLVGTKLKKKTGIKLEIQMHGDFFGGYYKGLKLNLAKFVLHRADKIRVVGERIKQSLSKLGIDKKKIEVKSIDSLYLFKIQKKIEEAGKNLNINLKNAYSGSKIFLWAGRMEPVKNLSWLIDVFLEVSKKRSDYVLLLVGEGSEKLNLENKVKKMGLYNKNIIFVPWKENVVVYINNADCVLFPSLSEGYGLVPMEANTAGTPVIMNDVGVANYELKPSEKVKILPINDKQAWIKAILEI